ncbi:MAG: type II toxin-antitoxin system ParD family antitoxin [Terriglobales bacterium]
MNVSLTPALEKFIAKKVKDGKYQTASEVVRDALRAMVERDENLARLREELRPSYEASKRGEFSDLTMEELKQEGRRRLAARRMKKVG